MTICDLEIGQSAVISAVGGEGALRQHFLDMGLISPTCTSIPAAGEKCWNPFNPARTFLTRESVKRAEEENETEMYRKIISFSHWREIRIAARPPCSTN